MHIHIIAGLYNSSCGKLTPSIFICRRIEVLKEKNVNTVVYIEHTSYSIIFKKGCKLLRGYYPKEITIPVDTKPYVVIENKYGISDFLCVWFNLHKIIHNTQPHMHVKKGELIHVHWAFPHGYYGVKIAKKLGVPCVITTHGSEIPFALKNRRTRKYMMWTLDNADRVIFVSNGQLRLALDCGYSGKNAVIIHNGVNTNEFYPIPQKDAINNTHWVKSQKYIIGYVGRLDHDKGADRLPLIFLEIKKIIGDVEFVVVGSVVVGSEKYGDQIKNQCKNFDLKISFVDLIPSNEVVFWMNLFDVLILPSRSETWGCVTQEAYACGVPVVGSDVGGIPEALCDAGITVTEGDNFEKRFADAVCSIIDGRKKIDKLKLMEIASQHTWEIAVEKELEVYHTLLNP